MSGNPVNKMNCTTEMSATVLPRSAYDQALLATLFSASEIFIPDIYGTKN